MQLDHLSFSSYFLIRSSIGYVPLTFLFDSASNCPVKDPKNRISCGSVAGITEEQCKAKGCCFDDTVYQVAWCFHPKGNFSFTKFQPIEQPINHN